MLANTLITITQLIAICQKLGTEISIALYTSFSYYIVSQVVTLHYQLFSDIYLVIVIMSKEHNYNLCNFTYDTRLQDY